MGAKSQKRSSVLVWFKRVYCPLKWLMICSRSELGSDGWIFRIFQVSFAQTGSETAEKNTTCEANANAPSGPMACEAKVPGIEGLAVGGQFGYPKIGGDASTD